MSRAIVEKYQKLLSPDALGTGNIPGGNITDADNYLKERLPIINCECGAEILVVPDLQAMDRAIKAHVVEHRQKERNTKNGTIRSGKIRQLLSQLTLTKISDQNNT